MAVFQYVVSSITGQRVSGEKEAANKEELINYLHSQNFTVISANEKIGVNFSKLFQSDIGGLPLADKVILLKQLATMVGANIPIIQAVDILVQQTDKPGLKAKLQNVYKSIEAGTTLSDAFRREPGLMSEVHLNLMAAGEKSANLNEMLDKIAKDLEKSKNLRGKITGALIYPVIIVSVMIVVIFIMLTTMVPQVKDLYTSLGQSELPFATQLLVNVGNSLGQPLTIITLLILVVGVFSIYKYAQSTEKGRELLDGFKLKIPVFGTLIQKSEVAQFCRLSAMLIKSGIQIIDTIQIVANASENTVFRKILLNTKEEVTKGSTVAVGLAKYNKKNAFPVILIRIIATGEEAGKFDKIMEDMSEFYESEVQQVADNLTKLMEPLIMIVAGGLVAFLAIAVYLPIFQVGQFVQS